MPTMKPGRSRPGRRVPRSGTLRAWRLLGRLLVLSAGVLLAVGALIACDITPIAGGSPPPSGSDPDDPDIDPGGNPPVGEAPPDGQSYPRIAAFVGRWEYYSPGEQDTMSRFDLLCLRAEPDVISRIHARNPDARIFFRVMPQTMPATSWQRPWSWLDRVRRYCTENDWVLRHHNGNEAYARGWGTYWRWGDFTSHCPEGTYLDPAEPELDSRGLTLAEWMATRFIPWFVANHMTGYEGLWWEVVAQQPTRYWWHIDEPDPDGGYLDWNRNHLPDRLEGGAWDRFVADWDSVSTWWVEEVRHQIGYSLPIIVGGDAYAPPLDYFDGFKNEDFLNRNRWSGPRWTWWDEFYTANQARPRRGYVYQRDHAQRSWSLSINQIFWLDDIHWQFSDPELRRRYVRFALATTLLGDGYFCFYKLDPMGDNRNPWMSEFYELELGSRADPFRRMVVGTDTLYTRDFRDDDGNLTGRVTVNPNDRPLAGVGAEDAVIEVFDGSGAP